MMLVKGVAPVNVMDESSPFEFELVPALPEDSRRTLRLLAREREFYRAGIVAQLGLSERLFNEAWPRNFALYRLDDTVNTARSLAMPMRLAGDSAPLILLDN